MQDNTADRFIWQWGVVIEIWYGRPKRVERDPCSTPANIDYIIFVKEEFEERVEADEAGSIKRSSNPRSPFFNEYFRTLLSFRVLELHVHPDLDDLMLTSEHVNVRLVHTDAMRTIDWNQVVKIKRKQCIFKRRRQRWLFPNHLPQRTSFSVGSTQLDWMLLSQWQPRSQQKVNHGVHHT